MYGREGILIVNHQYDIQWNKNLNLQTTISYINNLIADVKSRCGYVISAQDWYETEEKTYFWNWEKPVFLSEKFNFTQQLDQKNIDLVTITPDKVNSAYSSWSPEKNKIVKDILQEEKIKILHIVWLWLQEGVYSTVINAAETWDYDVYAHLSWIRGFWLTERDITLAAMWMRSAWAKIEL